MSSPNVPSSGRSELQTLNLRLSNATMDMPISLSNFTINGNVAFNSSLSGHVAWQRLHREILNSPLSCDL